MGQPDGVTPLRLASNEHLREVATIATEPESAEALSHTLAHADVAVPPAEELSPVVHAHHILAAQINQAMQALDRAEQNCAAAATTSAQHFAQQQAELSAAKSEAATLRDSLERQLATVYVRAADAESAADRLKRSEAELAEAVRAHQNLQERFSAVVILLQGQDADLEATTKRLTKREAELAEATETRLSLEKKLAEAESALDEAVRRSVDVRATAIEQAARRQSEFDALLREEVAKSDTLAGSLLSTREELAHADAKFQEAEARHALAMATAAAQFNEQEARHDARIAEAAAARDGLSRQLHEATAALDRARQEHQANATMAAERLAHQEATLREGTAARQLLDGQLAREMATRETLEQALTVASNKIAEAETAIRDAEQRHTSHITSATARFADQQVQYETRLAEAAADRDLVDQRLREVEASFERYRQEAAGDVAAAAERLATERLTAERQAAQRQTEFEAAIALETAGRRAVLQDLGTLQQKLADSESALRNAEQRHASEMKTAAGQFAERQRELETLSAQTTAARDASDLRLREAEATLERIRHERAAEAIAAAAEITRLESKLATATATGDTLERRLAELTNALRTAEELVASERVASSEQATKRQTEFDARLSLELGTRNSIEQALAATRHDLQQTEAALRDALAQHVKEMTSASNELSAQQLHYTMRLAEASAAHGALEQKLADADEQHASAVKAAATELAEQQSKYETRLAEAASTREIVSRQLHATETTLLRTQQERDANAIAFAERLSQRESELEAAAAARQVLEGRVADTETALKNAEAQALAERTATIQQSAQRQAEFDARLAREIEARTVVERDLAENRVAAEQTRQALLGQSAALTAEMRELEVRLTQERFRERTDYEAKLADLQRQLRGLDIERDALLQSLATHQAQLESLSRVHAASQEAAQQAIAKLQNELRAAVAAHRQQVEQLQTGLKAATNRIEANRAENQRQFDGSPIGILRCNGSGVISDANRALITTLGYRTVDELQALGSVASIFESPDDFRSFIETCETPGESIDWNWKKKDGSRLIMRLRAVRRSADDVEIIAEDLTTLRGAEERLRQAERMEAVGRLAAEVADTCDILLRNVSQDTQQWIATVDGDTAQRHQGELILSDVKRAASVLRQLSAYGEKQTSALARVDVNAVLRDLAPVLKRVAGDDIEIVLPKKVSGLNVDVDAERVERILVNITAYGRERMPLGGRMIVELARVVVDRDFITKYPNVRQGAHALIGVTKVRTAAITERLIAIREPGEGTAILPTPERPGIDLGVVQALVDDCGGHLWMNAEPGGDIELKIHLPLRAADSSGIAGAVRSALGRSVSSWFQS